MRSGAGAWSVGFGGRPDLVTEAVDGWSEFERAFETGEAVSSTYQRSDVTSVPAASVVGEAMVALVLASALLEKLGGDSLDQVEDAYRAWLRRLGAL